jgi:hypothetical protein
MRAKVAAAAGPVFHFFAPCKPTLVDIRIVCAHYVNSKPAGPLFYMLTSAGVFLPKFGARLGA